MKVAVALSLFFSFLEGVNISNALKEIAVVSEKIKDQTQGKSLRDSHSVRIPEEDFKSYYQSLCILVDNYKDLDLSEKGNLWHNISKLAGDGDQMALLQPFYNELSLVHLVLLVEHLEDFVKSKQKFSDDLEVQIDSFIDISRDHNSFIKMFMLKALVQRVPSEDEFQLIRKIKSKFFYGHREIVEWLVRLYMAIRNKDMIEVGEILDACCSIFPRKKELLLLISTLDAMISSDEDFYNDEEMLPFLAKEAKRFKETCKIDYTIENVAWCEEVTSRESQFMRNQFESINGLEEAKRKTQLEFMKLLPLKIRLFRLPKPITAKELSDFNENELLTVFHDNDNICRHIDASALLELREKIDFDEISNTCFYGMQRFSGPEAIDLGEIVEKLPFDTFKFAFKNLHPGTMANITAGQARHIQPPPGYCKHGLNLHYFNTKCIFAMSRRCVAEFIQQNPSELSSLESPKFFDLIKKSAEKSWEYGKKDICMYLSIKEMLQHKQEGIDSVDLLPDECWRIMKGLYKSHVEDLSGLTKLLRPTVFGKVTKKLHPDTIRSLPVNFAKTFATESLEFCKSDKVQYFSPHFLLYLNDDCLARIISSNNSHKAQLECHELISLYSRANQVYQNADFNFDLVRHNCQVPELLKSFELGDVSLLRNILETDLTFWPRKSLCSQISLEEISKITLKDSGLTVLSSLPSLCITSMKEFKTEGIVLSTFYPILPVTVFDDIPDDFIISPKNMEEMPEEFVSNFAKNVPRLCEYFDLTHFGQNVNLIDQECLKFSLMINRSLFKLLGNDTFVSMIKSDFTLCNQFRLNKLLQKIGQENVESNLDCLVNANDFASNVNLIAAKLTPEHLKDLKIPPTSELIKLVGPEKACFWAENNPIVCRNASHDILQTDLVKYLPERCQMYYWRNKKLMPPPDCIPVSVFQFLLRWKKYEGYPVDSILEASDKYQEVIESSKFFMFDLSSFSPKKKYSFAGFGSDILSSISRPLDPHLSKFIEPRQINIKVCSLHYEEDLPSEARLNPECLERMHLLHNMFPDHSYWYNNFWLDVVNLFEDDYEIGIAGALNDLLKEALKGQGESFSAYEFINNLLVDFFVADLGKRPRDLAKVSRQLKNQNFKTLSMIILHMESFFEVVKRPLNHVKIPIEIQENHKEGKIFPIFLFNLIEEHGFSYAGAKTQVYNKLGIDVGAVSRNLLDQCIDFIFNGPSEEMKAIEIEENTINLDEKKKGNIIYIPEAVAYYHAYRWNRPVLREAFSHLASTFFPFRASRKLGKFVAFTIAKALTSKLLPLIDFPLEFYRMVTMAKSDNELTEKEITLLNDYHDKIYKYKIGNRVLESIISYIKEDWADAFEENKIVDDILFPSLEVFDTPFGAPVQITPMDKTNYVENGACIESFTASVTTKKELDEYILNYQKSTYAEFRALLWEFKQVFNQAIDVEVFSSAWNPKWLRQITGDMNHTFSAQEIISSFVNNSHEIGSLVRNVRTGHIYKISVIRAISMFVEELPQSVLGSFVAFFTGSKNRILEPNLFKISMQIGKSFQCIVTENESYEHPTSQMRAEIIKNIYKRELEFHKVDPIDAELVETKDFYSISAMNCFETIYVHPRTNLFQLIYALVQQLNESSDNIVH